MSPGSHGFAVFLRLLLACAIAFFSGCHPDGDTATRSTRLKESLWVEHPTSPVLVPGGKGSWNELRADTGNSILRHKGRWHLYHSGEDAHAVSRIGLHVCDDERIAGPWQALRNRALLDPGADGSWDSLAVDHPSVLHHDRVFWMYYGGSDGNHRRIGLARSGNGIDWKKLPGPVFSAGPAGSWDAGGVMHPAVVYDGERFVMAYCGWPEGRSQIHSRIGIAVSSDGLKWSRPSNRPVLGFGRKGQWDEIGLLAPRLWVDNGRYYLNYSGKDAQTAMSSLGHASADTLDRWAKSANNPMLHHSRVRYHELEWGTPIWFENRWYLLATAYFDGGVTTLWQEVRR